MVRVYIGIGSNLGDRVLNCLGAIRRLQEGGVRILKTSSLYETEPHGDPSGPWYVNCVVMGETALEPRELLFFLQSVERGLGRRSKGGWLPREVDLDILFYGDRIVREEGLIIPHPLLHLRGFVLRPLVEVDPDLVHPVEGRCIRDLYYDLKDDREVKALHYFKINP